MRLSYAFFFILASLFTPAIAADDQSSQQEVVKTAAAFRENFDKQNSAGISALFTKDGVFVNPTGPHPDVAEFYEGAFKAGINQIEIAVKQATALGADTMIGIGEFQTSGKNASGAAIGDSGYWTAIYTRDGGAWKIRMLTALPKAPPPQ
ncbi:ketosteroid isomerase-like protein [Nitrobacteraceae bacterium AZCC 1564]